MTQSHHDPIPVFKPSITEQEIQAVIEVMRSGWLGLGPKTKEFEDAFAKRIGTAHCIALNSCTAALHLVMKLLNLRPEDEVIVTPMTFISTVHAIVYCGAKPVFADILPDTLNVNPKDVEDKITPNTRAILGVDMAGHPCDWDELSSIADRHGLICVEDAAHSCGASYKNRPVGTLVPLTCFSFHAVKNLTCGEGGAITCDDEWTNRWLREMRWLGISKDTWSRSDNDFGYKWKYWVNDFGYKYHMSDLAAAIGLVQLERLDALNAARRRVVEKYRAAFADLEWLELPTEKDYVRSSWHLFQVRLPDESNRDRFINHMSKHDIALGVHYIPAHIHPCYRQVKSVCPVASSVWKRLVTLPIFPDMTDSEQERIIEAVRTFEPD